MARQIKTALMIAVLLISLTAGRYAACDTAPETAQPEKEVLLSGEKYTLAVSDEFDSFDSGKWAYCPEQERQDAGGEWRNSCTSVSDGNLVLTCDIDGNGIPISGAIRSTGEYE
ncbi:MAG: hypothetical protein J6X60_07295, partial [Ruminiclostridium sp.]|nr:hypothetical protein [Ruminiclostridium sp.]